MMLKQISVFLENKPGTLNAPCKLLADNGISISTLSLADTAEFGVLRLIVREWEKAAQILKEHGFIIKVTDVVAIRVDHKAGSLAKILETLDKHSINVEYMYAFAAGIEGTAAVIFRFDDPEKALAKLKNEHITRIANADYLFANDPHNAV